MKRILAFGAALLFSLSAAAQFPSKPVRVIVPYTPGGGTDIISRALAGKMQETWGQQVLVENRPGANGIIGTEVMVKSPPDGHVVAMVVGAHVVNAVLQKSMPFDPIADTTAAEAGLPGYETYVWYGMYAPKGTPRDVTGKIQQEIARIVKLPEFAERFANLGADAVASTPDEFAAFTRAEHEKFARLVKAANIQPE